ncbi:hypothetical protein [Streptomyces sp. NPDC021212]|uniref:hypothetical protein n=1 Tax=Streptomyces sp. NPDC021212 TaxID=3365118 RepID=UPI00379F5416
MRRLYLRAGSPGLNTLAARSQSSPAGERLTAALVGKWLRDESIPSSAPRLRTLIELLQETAAASGGEPYDIPPHQWWESLRSAALREKRRGPGPEVHENAGEAADGEDPPEHHNSVDGESQIMGSSVQARNINEIHFHSAPAPPESPPRTPPSTGDARKVVLRWETQQETIEIYDEGIAMQWIRAHMQMGLGDG